MNSKDTNPNQGPMFDSMIKTFSQKAYINNGGELGLAPPVSHKVLNLYRISNLKMMRTVKRAIKELFLLIIRTDRKLKDLWAQRDLNQTMVI